MSSFSASGSFTRFAVCAAVVLSCLIHLGTESYLWGQDQQRPDTYSQLNRAQAVNRDVSFHQPSEISPGRSTTFVDLSVTEAINWFDGIELRHRSYNGGLVGPTIRVKPGQSLKVDLRNLLRPESQVPEDDHGAHGFNVTNLHTHGLHVSPKSPADDVYRQVHPGECFHYEFQIPADHHPGTFWYHAHKHGSTALQLASGMAGALIVEGGLDDVPEILAAEEKIMVLQQFTYREIAGGPAVVDPDLIYNGEGELVEAINGVVTPTIVMRPGEVQRWRIIHAGTVEAIRLDIAGVNFYEIAVDGLATGDIVEKDFLLLYPGYRSDVLVKAPDVSVESLMTSQISNADESIRQEATALRSLLRIVVEGDPKPMQLPTCEQLAPHAAFGQDDVPQDIAKRRELRFDIDGGRFLVDGEEFNPDEIKQLLELNTAEEWEIISDAGAHPFHIHVNPFACKIKGSDEPWVWRDTVAVLKRKPVILRTRYLQFTGKTVLHCHNLVHEDQGMMQAIEIIDPLNPPANEDSDPTPTDPVTATEPPDPERELEANLEMAPPWQAKDTTGKLVSSQQFKNKPILLVLHRGMHCIHCAEQLATLNQHIGDFEKVGISVVAVSQFLPEDEEALSFIREFKFPILVDEDLRCFQDFDCVASNGVPNHGLFLIDSTNRIRSEVQSEIAVTEKEDLIDRYVRPNLTPRGD